MNDSVSVNDSGEAKCVSLWIDDYDEIFSDFDPRTLGDRTISDDFVLQVKKVCREFKGKVSTLRILVPQSIQNEDTNKIIRKRIESYFSNVYEMLLAEMRAVRLRGIYFITAGFILMIASSYIRFLSLSGFYINLILVLFEPGGWFLFWTGSDQLVNYSRTKRGDIEFYRKISAAHVEFKGYA